MLKGKTVVLAISGSIAAYKMANVARMLLKQHCDVEVLMTQNATQFINPITFESLTGHKCLVDTFDRNFQYSVEHVALAKRADVVLVAPASANVIGKIANGIADDMLTTTVMACPCKKIVSPAMNHNMYHNPIVQDNIEKLKHFGYEIITPATGMLANGDIGDGRMPEESVLFEAVVKEIACGKDLAGRAASGGMPTGLAAAIPDWQHEGDERHDDPALVAQDWTNIRTTLTFFIISTINMAFLFVKAMTSGGPNGASDVALSYMYSQKDAGLYGYSMAIGVVIFLFSFALSACVNKATDRDPLEF